jgi:hypothetical protein
MSENESNARLDDAVQRRLAKLSARPMDTAAFDAALRRRLAEEASAGLAPTLTLAGTDREPTRPATVPAWSNPFTKVFSPLRAVAATLLMSLALVAGIVAWSASAGPAVASPQRLAEVHNDAVAGRGLSSVVHSIDEARAALQRKWPGTPELPEPRDLEVMSCCVHEIGRRQMACVTFRIDETPVTLAVASRRDIRSPHGQARDIAGRRYLVGSADGINMVMSEHEGTWMCLMGRLPMERLAEIVEELRVSTPQ